MARTITDGSRCRRNSKLETFLKRNTERDVYERIRAYEPCVVVSRTISKVFMHVVLSDDGIYLTEYPPRTLQLGVQFRDIVDIALINDLPDFLSGRAREQSLHICVVYTSAKDAGKGDLRNRGSAVCKPHPASSSAPEHMGRSAPVAVARVMKRMVRERSGEEQEAELHLYAVSLSSQIYLHLQSSWSSYIMRSTLMLDPLYMRKCNMPSSPLPRKQRPAASWEQTSQLFCQLSGELLQEHLGVESLYLLLQELCTAAHRDAAIRKLFWRSAELYPFLVHTLVDTSAISQDRPHTTDTLLLCTLLVQTLTLMFRETASEPARQSVLTSKQGSVTASMLQAVLTDSELALPVAPRLHHDLIISYTELQALQAEYLDVVSGLLFEVLVLCQEASHTPDPGHFLTVGWIFTMLQSHPSLVGFVDYQAQQVVLVLTHSRCPLSPPQAVLLYQRCTVLLACLQNNATLSTYITTHYKEEFKYYVGVSELKDKLPPHYPISKRVQHLLTALLHRVLHEPPALTVRERGP
ncbi:uncharacterized protein C12orf56 homolog [Electrophorus electricus]|uniref:uncharacterized protein C12orf56 homolog n=1 Tax=Electrophorus electricus TaxID=8005 RepID=UPI0015D036F4|nr:uncharacterized protein C12orf56 homolog [Electrophorus electricus]